MATRYTTHHGKRVSTAHGVMLAAYEEKHGRLDINQGARTLAEQAAFYAAYKRGGTLAAFPSPNAPHIKHRRAYHALDINANVAQDVAAFYRSHGVEVAFNVPGEPWHMDTLHEDQLLKAAAKLTPEPTIRKGSQGKSVQKLQVLLRGAGYLPKRWKVHTKYTLFVRRAVRKFQKDHKMTVDGVVGKGTWAALRKAQK